MGIESDQLVYEYLSRVGDLAQRRQVSSGDRMRLVAGLRDEIDRRRATYEPDTPAAVRLILERIGTPEEVVATVGRAAAPEPPVVAVPKQREPEPERGPDAVNVPPHLAGVDELGASDRGEPDWWRVAAGGRGAGPQVEGFAGGIEMPDLFEEEKPKEGPGGESGSEPSSTARRLVRVLRARRERKAEAAAEAGAPRARPNVFLLVVAAVLVAGAVTGSWMVLVVGWLAALASGVLGPRERKWVVFGVPGAVFLAALVWLWGRTDGRWGEALAPDRLGSAYQGLWPTLVRVAALTLAGYLSVRSRRR
ncbi:hypothetical protein [Streptomyces sp. RerS4]|uniref:hypothetical protein n=1 Tax=Streptomyces sp. RerS4 TaxID=2942449 RepID=UPI00201C0577|nr:hypothetical protein [Streptomyces sp. RerS4]UQX02299.1 hypothetical protein M4D82_18740 [Streptomyces sp. RerS4]